ncbi:hypothetical protein Lsed01_02499 [Demequina sediminis]|uniref:DUF697 domain-containing protein n=1 Tax=Demequina sediminis TaxID=1930058 RepID=A0ABP9WLC8_9MICO
MTVTTATTPTNTSLLLKALDRALTAQQPLAAAHVALMRRRRPDATPGQVIASLERQYISSLSASGAAVGATAAVPGVGTATAVALTAGETLTAIEQGVLLALAIAEVHDIRIDDIERRRTLVLAMMLGESGPKLVQKMAGRTGAHLGRKVTNSIPIETIRAINKVLGHNFVTRYGTKQGIVVIGRIAPLGIGAAIGGAGNGLMAWGVTKGARAAFGPAPRAWIRATPAPSRATASGFAMAVV